MEAWILITLFCLSLVLMFFFAGIEMAYYSANRINIEIRRKSKTISSGIISRFVNNPSGFIGTTILGFTLFLTLFSLLMSFVMAPVWQLLQLGSDLLKIVVEIALSTLIVIVLCGYLPRVIFRAKSTGLLARLWMPEYFFYQLFSPISDALVKLSKWLLKYIFNVRIDNHKQTLTLSDLKNLFKESRLQKKQTNTRTLLENAQEFPKIKVRHCLVPRKEIVAVPITSTIAAVKQKIIDSKYSKLIVYEKNIDNIKGFIHLIDLFNNPKTINQILMPIPTIPESMNASDLITKFGTERKSIAWVIDEFGGTAGIITMEDLLERLFGQIKDEYLVEKKVETLISENEFIFSGRLEINYLEDKYGLIFNNHISDTLSGYVVESVDTIPKVGSRLIIENYEFEILEATDTHIEQLKLKLFKI